MSYVLVIEQIAKACASTAEILVNHTDASGGITTGGTDELKRRHLPSLAKGEKLGTFAVSEPGCGCNPMNVETTAIADGGC